ncbi:MAG: site-2 protease family protein, partial [Deltaproteobacteria bacterium]|nr:site-2 protease family protein [Deltaproteobacteria bacterium]
MTTVLAFIILLGILIFFHELGHFLLAKANRVGVLKFSLGFGPAILKKRIGETEYRLSIFPLGGYVKMLGEDPDQEDTLPIDPQKSFTNKSLGAKASIVAAGPVSNLVLAIIIYTIIAWIGIPAFAPVVADVQEDSPAYHAGLLSGDTILSIEKNPIKTWDDISLIVQEVGAGKAVEMEIEREGTIFTVLVSPVITKAQNIFGEEIDRALIGITRTDTIITQHFGVIGGISYGFGQSYRIIELTGIAFWKIVNGTIDIKKSLGGPIMIADVSGQT